MKRTVLFIIIICFSIAARAVDLLDGYIVTAGNDTLRCKIKGGRFLTVPFRGATMINEQGEEQSFGAREKKVIAFGFVERFFRYDYLYVETGDQLESGYFQRIVNGARYKLYSRPTTVQGGNPTYVLFNPAGQFVKFDPCILCPWRKQLREFLKDDPKALELVENAPRVNIPKFVVALNKE
jgi:hypothetical protein